MTLVGYVTSWATEYASGIEHAAKLGGNAIEEYLFDVDTQWTFKVNKRGEFCGAQVEFAYSPKVTFNSYTGILRARDASAKHCAVVSVKVSDEAREEFNAYFADVFELAQACGDIPA